MKSQRTLKFRVWNKILNCFDDDVSIQQDGSILTYEWHTDYGKSWGGIYQHEEQNFIIQQFTGLLDKNGKEIYEGDILRIGNEYGYYICEVIWDEEKATYKLTVKNWELSHYSKEIVRVIGNIFEHPNLLKENI